MTPAELGLLVQCCACSARDWPEWPNQVESLRFAAGKGEPGTPRAQRGARAQPDILRTRLQLLAGVVLVSAVGLWALLGAHAGWTRTSVEVRTLDEVTGLEGIRYESRFVPGLDFLAAAALGAALLAGVSCLVRPKPDPTQIRP